jgi:hypothetical protein
MALGSLVGSMAIAYGPMTAMFLVWIARTPRYALVFLVSGFVCLLGMLGASVLWTVTGETVRANVYYTVAVGVTIQELVRGIGYAMYRRARSALATLAPDPSSVFVSLQYGLAMGMGFGVMSSLVYSINILIESYGPGTYYSPSCPEMPFFLTTGKSSSC